MEAAEIIERIKSELRRGGRPTRAYLDAGGVEGLSQEDGSAMTTQIFLNLEDRLCAIEARADEQMKLKRALLDDRDVDERGM